MANVLTPLARLCALLMLGVGCSSDPEPNDGSGGGPSGSGGRMTEQGDAGANATSGPAGRAGQSTSGGVAGSGGSVAAAGNPGAAGALAGTSSGPPPAVEGRSVYALECHGDSKDCARATVPCFGVASPTPNEAAGWACANRCLSDADCSDAPSGAEAQASCVPFSSARHCVLVCQNEAQTFACPNGMGCYVPPKSPIGYCLWQ